MIVPKRPESFCVKQQKLYHILSLDESDPEIPILRSELLHDFRRAFKFGSLRRNTDHDLFASFGSQEPWTKKELFKNRYGFRAPSGLVIVAQPWRLLEFHARNVALALGAEITFAQEWSFYEPAWTNLFLFEFPDPIPNPAELYRRWEKRPIIDPPHTLFSSN